MAFNLQKAKKIATLCMIIACLDDDEERIRKKGLDRDLLRRRAVRGSYTGIVTELAAKDLPSFKRVVPMTQVQEKRPFLI